MVNYEVTVSTANLAYAGTLNNVFIKLVGTDGESNRTWLMSLKGPLALYRGAVSSFTVSCPVSIGKLVRIELDKQRFPLFFEDSWFPAKVVVKSPEGDTYKFPIYRWINDCEVHCFREATALRAFEDENDLDRNSRLQELIQRRKHYSWNEYEEGIPHSMKAESPSSLPCEVQFSFTKKTEFLYTASTGDSALFPDYVKKHWKEDAFFGYQFLNGVNPMLIRRCSALPENFPVPDNKVSLCGQWCLASEMQNGNIFLCDYKSLDGLKPNTIDEKEQYLMAPLVLLHKTPDDKLMPIAIQLKQTPAADNPIFYPTDSYDWLMVKTFVRSADFNEHQLNAHLLRTHLLAEVFAVSLLRNVPMVHPLYKLLIPHTRYTLHINYLARDRLISETGFFLQFAASGGEGMMTLLKRSLASLTYSSLCIPEDIAERGLDAVPNFYYRDDGLKLWDIIHRFVQGVLGFYYKKDAEVKEDFVLQTWISDIFKHGFLSLEPTGIPQSFTTVAELVKFVTMVIFTCTGQHSAVNTGQYDYGGWMPNAPTTLRLPPPTTKGTTSEATMLKTLPDQGTTVNGMAAMWLLSKPSSDYVPLGQYLDDHFSEEIPCQLIRAFQGELQVLSAHINIRNKNLEVPYTYMDPAEVENSVAI
ncbi:arachidonate 12-lipoxygenase, 12R-type-like [Sebastes fasciatus]|uniref:arachidonate 12-lipoxygenase, 12R-type-like n=1 Tax=Sebastes fasciatus TaxID=394691 RepID=UPI003D9DBE9D